MDPRWKHPFTSLIAGPTGSGKTVFVHRFLENLQDMITPTHEKIIYCYGEWQPAYKNMKGVHFNEGLPDIEQWQSDKRRLVVIDHLISETDDRLLFMASRHLLCGLALRSLYFFIMAVGTRAFSSDGQTNVSIVL